ncbi:MAG: NAD(P)H-hydrate epimerase [Planctomycetota bacterium]|nr:MAG: NAD(P)H-hydrate epimerase [Planctomycetota bacterium]
MSNDSPPLYLSREQSRRVDRLAIEEYGIPGIVLMENAGRSVAQFLDSRFDRGETVICCGRGNNAGDGFVIARHLQILGHSVRVVLCADPEALQGDAGVNYRIAVKSDIPILVLGRDVDTTRLQQVFQHADCLVDALLGTGARGAPRPPLDAVISAMNAAAGSRVAVDLPSGLDCDTGTAPGVCFRAHFTCTFVARKQGFASIEAQPYLGEVHVMSIGVPPCLVERVAREQA